tara:strand:- start:10078 stop:10407 length:330 start_codon:yes stop_codon:yes gene_type:complete
MSNAPGPYSKEALECLLAVHHSLIGDNEKLQKENTRLKAQLARLTEENEKLAETADDTPDQCEMCDTRFDLHYTMNHCDKELRKKYDDYFDSPDDDFGDICPDCILHHK